VAPRPGGDFVAPGKNVSLQYSPFTDSKDMNIALALTSNHSLFRMHEFGLSRTGARGGFLVVKKEGLTGFFSHVGKQVGAPNVPSAFIARSGGWSQSWHILVALVTMS
jgi:hypothetical protein